MSAAEEAWAAVLLCQTTNNPNTHLQRLRDGSTLSTEAKAFLDEFQDADSTFWKFGDYFPFYSLDTLRVSVANALEASDEDEIQVEYPADRSSPLIVTSRRGSVLLVLLTLGALLLSGCTSRPRITSGGDTHYSSTTTITIGELPPSGTVPDKLAPLLGLARRELRLADGRR